MTRHSASQQSHHRKSGPAWKTPMPARIAGRRRGRLIPFTKRDTHLAPGLLMLSFLVRQIAIAKNQSRHLQRRTRCFSLDPSLRGILRTNKEGRKKPVVYGTEIIEAEPQRQRMTPEMRRAVQTATGSTIPTVPSVLLLSDRLCRFLLYRILDTHSSTGFPRPQASMLPQ